ncbi:hypothetical protein BDP27DRAFT_1426811 [Rhodocollybia butyracea]|uniref:Uncharacterized protein n=1 Tax=Rhodocollybia butyracea TaxID=206335 RepID=A0A9P5PDB9_9AGAR|nr:hypothetical protein BDP27DRAFT_1426811 [Rhodocollybia butyracea]
MADISEINSVLVDQTFGKYTVHVCASRSLLRPFNYLGRDHSTPPNLGCHTLLSSSNASSTAVGWEGLLIVDSILFAMTMRKAWQTKFLLSGINIQRSLFSVVVRDGSAYFLIMTLLNLANIISLHIPSPLEGNFSAFVGCLSVTLMSRIVLNLHEAADTGIYTVNDVTISTTPG